MRRLLRLTVDICVEVPATKGRSKTSEIDWDAILDVDVNLQDGVTGFEITETEHVKTEVVE